MYDFRGVNAKALRVSDSLRCCQLRVCDSVVRDKAENTVLLLLLLGDVEQRVSAVPAVIQQAICTAQDVHSSNLQQLQASCCPYSALPHVLLFAFDFKPVPYSSHRVLTEFYHFTVASELNQPPLLSSCHAFKAPVAWPHRAWLETVGRNQ